MQPDPITLSVNDSGDGSTMVDHVFNRKADEDGHSTYIGPDASFADGVVDKLELYFKEPRPASDYPGNCRPAFKRTKSVDYTFNGETRSGLAVTKVEFSFPSGLALADQILLKEEIEAMLNHTVWASVMNTGMV